MLRYVFVLTLLACASGVAAQDGPGTAPDTTRIYLVVAESPAPVGGLMALAERVVYPPEAAEAGVQGRVYVEMVIERDGHASNPVCVRAPSPALCTAAL
ncbi:MAG: energy transducer TonB, partial [Bacteroidota bacterium]